MQGKVRERWLKLCELAADEQDPERLAELVNEIYDVLERKVDSLEGKGKATRPN